MRHARALADLRFFLGWGIMGRMVMHVLLREVLGAGSHELRWLSDRLRSGFRRGRDRAWRARDDTPHLIGPCGSLCGSARLELDCLLCSRQAKH